MAEDQDQIGPLERLFPLNRIVALLGPPVIALAGIVTAWLADHLPFIAEQVDSGEIEAIFLGTVAAGVTALYKWLDNWGKWEARHDPPTLPAAPAEAKAERHRG